MNGGIPYFSLDTHLDSKFSLIEAEFGLTGFGVVVRLYQWIYGQQGYYLEWSEEVALLFAKEVGLGGSAVSEIVSASIRRGIFDKTLFDKYRILTSVGVQKRYFEAVKRRKKVEVKKAYLLLDVSSLSENVDISDENVCRNTKNVDIFEQRKEKERKEKERKGEEIYTRIIAYLNNKAGTKFRANTSSTIAKIKSRLDENYTEQDFYTVIDKKCAEWMGTEQERYLRPETLFGGKFEGYLNEKVTKKRNVQMFYDENDILPY